MSTTETILLIAGAVILLALLAWAIMRTTRSDEKRLREAERLQAKGAEHHAVAEREAANAEMRQARADKARAEAAEKEAQARRDEAVAGVHVQVASDESEQAEEHLRRAGEVHPGDTDEVPDREDAAARARINRDADGQAPGRAGDEPAPERISRTR